MARGEWRQVHASMTQRKRLKQLHWDKIRTVPENSLWSKTPKVCSDVARGPPL